MSLPIIDIQHVSKRYQIGTLGIQSLKEQINHWWKRQTHPDVQTESAAQTIWALNDVSLSINPGEMLGIIGRNGAGKSTLLKILSRVTPPTIGTVYLRGRTASLLEVGTGFHPDLTGRENIFLNGAILGMKKKAIHQQFDSIVDFSGVERFVDTPIKRYSSGMVLRLAFAVAAHLDAEITIVDEVLAVGDAAFQKKCIDKMQERTRKGKTVLFVSHQLAILSALCPRSIWLQNGHIQADGPSTQVVGLYLQHNQGMGDQHEWHNHEIKANPVASLKHIRLKSPGNNLEGLSIEDPFYVEIDFEVFKQHAAITCYIVLMDQYDHLLIHTAPLPSTRLHATSSIPTHYSIGQYRYRCHLPAHLLTDGHYRVHVYLAENTNQEIARAENALNFSLQDTPGWHEQYVGRWPGLIRPKCDWELESL